MSLLDVILVATLVCAIFAYFPLTLAIIRRDRTRIARRRPVNEILADALAEGRITQEQFDRWIDEVHRSMPSLDRPYPQAREFEEHKL